MKARRDRSDTRRLRRFVLLVIFAVTLPSLLLSGFGSIAISNERDVARQRVHELYDPVVRKLAMRLKAQLKSIVEQAEQPLAQLADWADRRTPPPTRAWITCSSRSRP